LALAGAGSLARPPPALAAVGALETTTLRLTRTPALCVAPLYVAEELLRAEGFTDIRHVATASATASANAIGAGQADLSFDFASAYIIGIDSGQAIAGSSPGGGLDELAKDQAAIADGHPGGWRASHLRDVSVPEDIAIRLVTPAGSRCPLWT